MRVPNTTSNLSFPAPRRLLSSAEGNVRAPHRDLWRRCDANPFGMYSDPLPGDPVACVMAYLAPGERVPISGRRRYSEILNRKTTCAKRGELEFSAPSGASLPGRYRRSTILWALSISDAVLICVDHARGIADGEAHRVLSHRQCVFRCSKAEVDAWIEYLSPLLLSTHLDFAVVRLAGAHA